MSSPAEPVSAALLRTWGLPSPGESKKTRGDVIVVGGSRSSPGAALLAGEAALRVGAGRVALAVPRSIDAQVGVALPEAGVFPLPDDADQPFDVRLAERVSRADAVLVGPGFDDPDETRATLLAVAAARPQCVVLDAYALGVLPRIDRGVLPDAVVLSPNKDEAGILLERDVEAGDESAVREIAERFTAVVNCYGVVAAPGGAAWRVDEGGGGLGTSGSGDVLAGAIAGFAARGAGTERAAVWGAWSHARAGDRLTDRVGIGFLASDLARELTTTIRDTLADDA